MIRARAESLGCPWYEVKEEKQELKDYTPEGIRFVSDSRVYGKTELFIPFIARYQMMNGALALETMGVLKKDHQSGEGNPDPGDEKHPLAGKDGDHTSRGDRRRGP